MKEISICEVRLSRNRGQPPVPSQPERKSQQNDSEHEGIRPNPQHNSQSSSSRCEQDQQAKQRGKNSHQKQEPFVRNYLAEANTRHYFKDPREDRPKRDQEEQGYLRDRRPRECEHPRDDSDHPFNEQCPMV